jgi:hypothetical protein
MRGARIFLLAFCAAVAGCETSSRVTKDQARDKALERLRARVGDDYELNVRSVRKTSSGYEVDIEAMDPESPSAPRAHRVGASVDKDDGEVKLRGVK